MKHIKKFNDNKDINVSNPTKVIEVDDDYIEFDNGIVLSSHHSEDCCEHHYIDFTYVNLDDFNGLEFDLSSDAFFNGIPGYGIELIPIKGWGVRIPGYGSNNGYYSSNLSLELSDGRMFDISDCQEITGE